MTGPNKTATHYVVCVEVPVEKSARVVYYRDADYGDDIDAACRRMKAMILSGRSAWIETFYGPITSIGRECYQLIEKPQEDLEETP